MKGQSPSALSNGDVIQIHPLISEDEHQFLDGDMSAEKYLSRGSGRGHSVLMWADTERTSSHWIKYSWLLAGFTYLVTSIALFFVGSSKLAVVGIVASTLTMVVTLVFAEIRGGHGDRQ